MEKSGKKIVLIGTGFVGMSYAYALLNQNVCDELILIDIDRVRSEGEAMDLNHGLAFSSSHMKISAGDYADCRDASLVAICAGVAQRPGESRIDLLLRNKKVFEEIVGPVADSGFSGIFLVATNPVDIMTQITRKLSGFDSSRVIGTGTALDSARLRYLLGEYFRVDPRNVHAYVMGEHGDSEFVPWSQALVATKPILSICEEKPGLYKREDLDHISGEVRDAAQKIILAKRATYYGIGMAMTRITKAILGDEHSVLTVSAMMGGEYGLEEVYIGTPCIVGRDGVLEKIQVRLNQEELGQLQKSAKLLKDTFSQMNL